MDHRCVRPLRARHRVVLARSGNGRTIEPWGSVISYLAVTLDLAKSRRRGRLHDIDQCRRKRGDTHQPAALPVGRLRSFLRDRFAVQRHRHQAMVAIGVCVQMLARVIVHMAILVDMLRRHFAMYMNHARHMILVSQTMGDGMFAGQSIRDRRRQHAKQVAQGDEPPRSQSPRSAQADEHFRADTFGLPLLRVGSIAAKLGTAKMELERTIIVPYFR